MKHPNERETSNSMLLGLSAAASHCKKRVFENNIRTKSRKNFAFVLFGNEAMKPGEENFPWWSCCHLLGISSSIHHQSQLWSWWNAACVVYLSNMLSLFSRLANSQLDKEKAELIHQIEVNKDQTGAGSSTPGNVFCKTCWLSQVFDVGLSFCVFL